MRIFSNYKDYYDVIEQGSDGNIIFKRNVHEFDILNDLKVLKDYMIINNVITPILKTNGKLGYGREFHKFLIIGFCGQVFPLVKVDNNYLYGKNEINDFIKKYDSLPIYPSLNFFKYGLDEVVNEIKKKDYFVNHNCSHFLIDENILITNPNLSNFKFQKIKDPFTAFNEIESFISERLIGRMESPELDDKGKIVSKGFDLKTSFRKV